MASIKRGLMNEASAVTAEQIHCRRILAATKYPVPTSGQEYYDKIEWRKSLKTWEKQCESRLLAEDPGFLGGEGGQIWFFWSAGFGFVLDTF